MITRWKIQPLNANNILFNTLFPETSCGMAEALSVTGPELCSGAPATLPLLNPSYLLQTCLQGLAFLLLSQQLFLQAFSFPFSFSDRITAKYLCILQMWGKRGIKCQVILIYSAKGIMWGSTKLALVLNFRLVTNFSFKGHQNFIFLLVVLPKNERQKSPKKWNPCK